MKSKLNLNKYLGESFFSELQKSEVGPILKEDAKVSVFPHEMMIALQIVPRTVISLLVQHLKPLKPKEHTVIPWYLENGICHEIRVQKISSDLYSGEITGEGRVLARFQYRSLPAVGLVIMSTYEMYDKETNKQDTVNPEFNYDKVQSLIDEKIRLQMTIESVVNKKLSEREAVKQLIDQKIKDYLRTSEEIKANLLSLPTEDLEQETSNDHSNEEESEEEAQQDSSEGEPSVKDIDVDKEVMEPAKVKKGKLKKFLEESKSKTKKNEKQTVDINNSKDLHCPDCQKKLYKSGDSHIEFCICYGEWMGKTVKFAKSEQGAKFNIPKNFDKENLIMLLETIKKR